MTFEQCASARGWQKKGSTWYVTVSNVGVQTVSRGHPRFSPSSHFTVQDRKPVLVLFYYLLGYV